MQQHFYCTPLQLWNAGTHTSGKENYVVVRTTCDHLLSGWHRPYCTKITRGFPISYAEPSRMQGLNTFLLVVALEKQTKQSTGLYNLNIAIIYISNYPHIWLFCNFVRLPCILVWLQEWQCFAYIQNKSVCQLIARQGYKAELLNGCVALLNSTSGRGDHIWITGVKDANVHIFSCT